VSCSRVNGTVCWLWNSVISLPCELHHTQSLHVGFVELCAKILQIMRNDFKDYACTFCQLFLPLFAKNLFMFCITHSRIQDRPILCLWDRQNSLPPSSKTSDFLYCLARGCTNISRVVTISKIPDVQQNVIHK